MINRAPQVSIMERGPGCAAERRGSGMKEVEKKSKRNNTTPLPFPFSDRVPIPASRATAPAQFVYAEWIKVGVIYYPLL